MINLISNDRFSVYPCGFRSPLIFHQVVKELVKIAVQTLHEVTAEYHGIVVGEEQFGDSLVFVVLKDETERLRYVHLFYLCRVCIESLTHERSHMVIESVVRIAYPVADDAAVNFLVVIIESQHLAAVLYHSEVQIGENYGFVAARKFGYSLLYGSVHL